MYNTNGYKTSNGNGHSDHHYPNGNNGDVVIRESKFSEERYRTSSNSPPKDKFRELVLQKVNVSDSVCDTLSKIEGEFDVS